MKVWIVHSFWYTGDKIAGIYSSQELADDRVQEFKRIDRVADWNIGIEVYDVDVDIPICHEASK